MSTQKLAGFIKEIVARYPNVDVADYLEFELGIPKFKAERLAKRIEESCLQKQPQKAQNQIQRLFEPQTDELPKSGVYRLDCVTEKEFKNVICWVLEESGYRLQPENATNFWGFEVVAEKTNEKVAIQAVRIPNGFAVSEPIIAITKAYRQKQECTKALIIAAGTFTDNAIQKAQEANIELWNNVALNEKITQADKNCTSQVQPYFPPYQGSLFNSLLKLEESRDFLIEIKADWRYELLLPGVKYPLLTFQARNGTVTRCIFRITYNEPVTEAEGELVLGVDEAGNRIGPNEGEVYKLVTQYLEQFLE
jgi:hypothetical protein